MMKLLYSPTSPYARKARIVALEKGLGERVEIVSAIPWPDPTPVIGANPLGKVPVLILADGTALYDSPVICEYLDSLVPASPLIPYDGMPRWLVLRRQALCDGILDAAVGMVLESRRPPAEQSASAQARATDAIRRSVEALARELKSADEPFDLAQISSAVAIGYLGFRLKHLDLGTSRPEIQTFWNAIKTRPSVASTEPPV
jgi:glutathione S-transferase